VNMNLNVFYSTFTNVFYSCDVFTFFNVFYFNLNVFYIYGFSNIQSPLSRLYKRVLEVKGVGIECADVMCIDIRTLLTKLRY